VKIRVYDFAESTKALGPFERCALWVQGCPFHCKNCMTPDSIALNEGIEVEINILVDKILSLDVEGITISGGEPFLQSKELYQMLNLIKQKKDLGVIVYTGFEYENIKDNKLLNFIDILIDGKYIDELNDNSALRGSSNQNVYFLTDRYKKFKNLYNSKKREIEIRVDDVEVSIIGIPSKNTLQKIKGLQ